MGKKEVKIIANEVIEEPIVSKKKYSICKKCGIQFSQIWDFGIGEYSNFRECNECIKEKQSANKKSLTFALNYEPYDYQKTLHESKARIRVVSGGIRSGKDYAMVTDMFIYAIKCANESRPDTMIPKVKCWIVAPTEQLAMEDFNQLKRVVPAQIIADYSRSTRTLVTTNGIEIEVKSAYNPESLVGVGLDCVLITEAARIRDLEDVWSNLEGRLTSQGRGLGGKGGIALINSSPLGKNYFYKMWLWGQKNSSEWSPEWESWTWEHWDNPHMKAKENVMLKNGLTYRQDLERRMSKSRYEQDYLAKFLSDEYAVFPDFDKKCLVKIDRNIKGEERDKYIKDWELPQPFMNYTIGYDPAEKGDGSIVWVIENDTGALKKAVNLRGMNWDGQFDSIAMISRKYNNARVNFGRTGLGMVIESQLAKRGINCTGYNEQGGNKASLVENLARIVESDGLKILDDGSKMTEQIKFEFGDYIRELKKQNTVYRNATSDSHDDNVSAAYFAFANFETETVEIPYIGLLEAL